MKTRSILKKDFHQISNLWMDSLNNDIFAILGKKIILSYLIFFISDKKNFGFVIENKNKITAFLLYGKDDQIIKKIVFRNFFYLLFKPVSLLINIEFKKIKIFFDVMIFYVLSKFRKDLDEINTELLYICVKRNKTGSGLGKKIVKDSFKMKKKFFENNEIKVKTLKKTRKNVIFYQNLNFKIKKKFFGRIFLVI